MSLLVTLAFVAGLFLAAGLVWLAALIVSDLAHRMRGDVRCTGSCPCRGTRPVQRG